ncbi:hypothetical protein P280DRAFT_79287 [Massarina eburnea CBS 473.64]|uniref:Ig-like domain-containing protein n=1 Tax=Massarina eburnea CBS 473.64 TaxID=1395130 RepID=A0A6A6RV34_9PLEO|nr:hypothetical protein P280DRAFT_79287 [Massarina eburnea CBS 473.64]
MISLAILALSLSLDRPSVAENELDNLGSGGQKDHCLVEVEDESSSRLPQRKGSEKCVAGVHPNSSQTYRWRHNYHITSTSTEPRNPAIQHTCLPSLAQNVSVHPARQHMA